MELKPLASIDCTCSLVPDESDVPGHEAVILDVLTEVAFGDVLTQTADHHSVVRHVFIVAVTKQ